MEEQITIEELEPEFGKIGQFYKETSVTLPISLSNRFLTTSIGSLAFIITMLIQIRIKQPIESDWLVAISLFSILFSLVIGYWLRLRVGLLDRFENIESFFRNLSSLHDKLQSKRFFNDIDSRERKKWETIVLIGSRISKMKPNDLEKGLGRLMTLQWLLLSIGLICATIYFSIFLLG